MDLVLLIGGLLAMVGVSFLVGWFLPTSIDYIEWRAKQRAKQRRRRERAVGVEEARKTMREIAERRHAQASRFDVN